MEKKSFFENISELKKNIEAYLEVRFSLIIVTAFQKAVKALTIIISSIIFLLFLFTAIVFVSAALAIYLGKALGSFELGLLLTAGLYLLLGFVFLLFRRQIFSRLIIIFLINVFFRDDEDDRVNNNTKK